MIQYLLAYRKVSGDLELAMVGPHKKLLSRHEAIFETAVEP